MKILITAGPTIEPIDPVRHITNFATGRLGISIAKEAKKRGHDVQLIYGQGTAEPPKDISIARFTNTESLLNEVLNKISSVDVFISSAAVSDYTPVNVSDKKIESNNPLTIELKPTPKVIKIAKEKAKKGCIFVAFKLAYDITKEELINKAINSYGDIAEIIIANDLKNIKDNQHLAYIILKGQVIKEAKTKDEIAEYLLDILENSFKNLGS